MLKINKDMSVEFDDDVNQEDIVCLLLSYYNGQLSSNMANKIRLKDEKWKKDLEELFLKTLNNMFEEEFKNLFLSFSKPFFNKLEILQNKPKPFINPIVAFKNH